MRKTDSCDWALSGGFVNSALACPYCGLLQSCPGIGEREVLVCRRCHSRLMGTSRLPFDAMTAIAVAALVFLLLGFIYPFLKLDLGGRYFEASVMTAIVSVFTDGRNLMGILVLFPLIAFPFIEMAGLVYVLSSIRFSLRLPFCRIIYRWIVHLREWSMIDVFLLGILVAVVKLSDIAEVSPGIGLYLLAAAMCLLMFLIWCLEPGDVWIRLEQQR